MDHKRFMRLAIDKAHEGKIPFAACIVKNSKVIACEYSGVFPNNDPTAHGEVQTIRAACKKIRKPNLGGATMYTTCRSCAMCTMACYWAGINRIVYGATLKDSADNGWADLDTDGSLVKKIIGKRIKWTGGVMRKQCLELFESYRLSLR